MPAEASKMDDAESCTKSAETTSSSVYLRIPGAHANQVRVKVKAGKANARNYIHSIALDSWNF